MSAPTLSTYEDLERSLAIGLTAALATAGLHAVLLGRPRLGGAIRQLLERLDAQRFPYDVADFDGPDGPGATMAAEARADVERALHHSLELAAAHARLSAPPGIADAIADLTAQVPAPQG
jgi:hypothetical protein